MNNTANHMYMCNRMLRRGILCTRRSLGQRALLSSAARRLRLTNATSSSAKNVASRSLSVTSARMLPPHELITLPALSPTMETGTIKQWEVSCFLF